MNEIGELGRAFKSMWYSTLRMFETLAEFKEGSDPNFRHVLERAKNNLNRLESKLEEISFTMKKIRPELKDEVDSVIKPVISGVRELIFLTNDEITKHKRYERLTDEYRSIKAELEEVERERREVEDKVSKICNKFFERRRDFVVSLKKIKQELKAELEKLERSFVERAGNIAEDYKIFRAGEELTPEELFRAIIDNPSSIQSLHLKSKKPAKFLGLFGDNEEKIRDKLSVLKFLCEEISSEAEKLKEEFKEKEKELKVEFADIDSIEKACKDIEKRRQELLGYSEELRNKLTKIKKELPREYSDYNQVLEVKQMLEQSFKKWNSEVEKLIEFIEKEFGNVEIEKDPEKKILKEKISELEENIKISNEEKLMLEKKIEELKIEIDDLNRRLKKSNEIIEKLNEEKSNLQNEIRKLEEENSELRRENEGLKNKISKIKEKIESNLKELLREE